MDQQYFELIHTELNGNTLYHAYKMKQSGIACYTQDGQIIAGLQINCTNGVQSIIANKNNNKCPFQIVISESNSEFELILTNFTDNKIIFNLVYWDYINNTPKSSYNINQINVIKGKQSVSIKSDNTNDNKAFVIQDANNKGGSTTVKVAEEKQDVGDSSYLAAIVIPQVGGKPEFASKFKNLIWRHADVVIVEELDEESSDDSSNFMHGMMEDNDRFGGFGHNPFCDSPQVVNENFVIPRSIPESISINKSSMNGPFIPMSNNRNDLEEESGSIGGLLESDDDDIINQSTIGKITGGKKIEVTSTKSNDEFDYECQSVPLITGLSISNKLKIQPCDKQLYVDHAKEIIWNIINNNYKQMLQNITVYEEDTCCICLDENEKPNVVLYQCGHKCVHKNCLMNKITNCPLCRSIIQAILDV